jgi:pimeloyl-ACP methyl ester carboxylesterase
VRFIVVCCLTFVNCFALAAEEKFFSQEINHLNPRSNTFQQRYFVDRTYAQGELAPIVLELCGEAECSLSASENQLKAQIAIQAKAELISLEHRYYGKSHPFSNLESNSLQFLTVEQAILDVRSFQRKIDPQNKRKWFVLGSSYAGTLAAIYRQRYPELTVGALSSSAPLRAVFAFTTYDKYTSDTLGPQCSQKVRDLVTEIENKIIQKESLQEYKDLFEVPHIQNDLNFLFLISEFTTAFVQFGFASDFCQGVENIGALEAIAYYVNAFYADGQQLDLSDWGFETLSNTRIESTSAITRQWWYQVCREMGFFQVANPIRQESVRSTLLNEQFFKTICEENYGLENTQISEFNQKYYEPLRTGQYSRIIFTNGTEDPWTMLTLMAEDNPLMGQESLLLLNEGGSHSSELYSRTGVMSELQQNIISTATVWLRE